MSFGKQVRAFNKKTTKKAESAIIKIGLTILKEVIENTPVLDGQAINNWFVEFDRISLLLIEGDSFDKSGTEALIRGSQEIARFDLRRNQRMYVYNNLPYIQRLEDGYSTKNRDMVKKALERVQRDLPQIIKEVGNINVTSF